MRQPRYAPGSRPASSTRGVFAGGLVILALALGAAPAFGQVAFTGPTQYNTGQVAVAVVSGDFNGDADPDLAVSNAGSDAVSVLIGGPGAGFTGPTFRFSVPDPGQLQAADIDGDGDLDLAILTNDGASVSVLLGAGNGTFGAATPIGATPGFGQQSALAVGDLDGDSDPDLVVASRSTASQVAVLLGRAGATFSPPQVFASGARSEGVAIADFDLDGDGDVAVTNIVGADLAVLLGDGQGGLAEPIPYSTGSAPTGLAVGDLNLDGDVDLAVADQGSNDVAVLLGQGGGGFGQATPYPTGAAPRSVAFARVDSDAFPDLIVPNDGDGSFSVLLGAGDGTVSARTDRAVFTDPFQLGPWLSLAVADMNGDLRDDVALVNARTLSGNGGVGGVSILVNGTSANRPPVAVDDAYSTPRNTPLVVAAPGLLANDSDPDGSPINVVSVTNGEHGAVTFEADGSFSYSPQPGFTGADEFSYQVTDGELVSNASVVVTVEAVDLGDPVASPDAYSAIQSLSLGVPAPGLLANDTVPPGETLRAELVETTRNCCVSLNADGSFEYTTGVAEDDSFRYRVYYGDPEEGTARYSEPAVVTIAVRPNSPPVAVDDAFTTVQGAPLSIPIAAILANDSDPDGDALTYVFELGGPTVSNGTATVDEAAGVVVYAPNPGFTGDDSFVYRAADATGLNSASARVTISVTPTPAASVSIADATPVVEGDTGTKAMRFTLTRTGSLAGAATVRWHTEDGTATVGEDYEARRNRTVRFASGAATATVSVPVVGDRIGEEDETLRVLLDSSTGAPIGDGEAVGTIVDNDPPSLTIADAAVAEGRSGTKSLKFAVRLSRRWNAPVTVQWRTEDLTATAGSDYAAASGTVTIEPGTRAPTAVSVPAVTINGDRVVEPDETLRVVLSAPSGAEIIDGEAVGTIRNDD